MNSIFYLFHITKFSILKYTLEYLRVENINLIDKIKNWGVDLLYGSVVCTRLRVGHF